MHKNIPTVIMFYMEHGGAPMVSFSNQSHDGCDYSNHQSIISVIGLAIMVKIVN